MPEGVENISYMLPTCRNHEAAGNSSLHTELHKVDFCSMGRNLLRNEHNHNEKKNILFNLKKQVPL